MATEHERGPDRRRFITVAVVLGALAFGFMAGTLTQSSESSAPVTGKLGVLCVALDELDPSWHDRYQQQGWEIGDPQPALLGAISDLATAVKDANPQDDELTRLAFDLRDNFEVNDMEAANEHIQALRDRC